MKNKENQLDEIFKHFENQWDICELQSDHENKFIRKQYASERNRRYYFPLAIAATILLLFGLFIFTSKNSDRHNLSQASTETQKTDSVFNAMLQFELQKMKEKKSPLNEKIINDALLQIEKMDQDYEKIKLELLENGENQQIIYALIHNYKVRIDFLERVLKQLNNTEKLNITTDEKTI